MEGDEFCCNTHWKLTSHRSKNACMRVYGRWGHICVYQPVHCVFTSLCYQMNDLVFIFDSVL